MSEVTGRDDYIQVERADDSVVVRVMAHTWVSPSRPDETWVVAAELPFKSTDEDIARAVQSIQNNPKFFRTCQVCGRVMLSGDMHSDTHCYGCASQEFGIVF